MAMEDLKFTLDKFTEMSEEIKKERAKKEIEEGLNELYEIYNKEKEYLRQRFPTIYRGLKKVFDVYPIIQSKDAK